MNDNTLYKVVFDNNLLASPEGETLVHLDRNSQPHVFTIDDCFITTRKHGEALMVIHDNHARGFWGRLKNLIRPCTS